MRKAQQGTSYVAVMLVVICIAFVIKVAVVLWAPYFDDRMINNQIVELMQDSPKNMLPDEFVTKMDQRLAMNRLSDLKFQEIAKVSNQNGLIVEKNYELRKPFLLNIDLVLKFEKNFEQSSIQAK